MIAISGVCYNCTNWSNPPLDLTSTAAPFLFAVGPISDGTSARWSNLPDAPLRRHTLYGQFSMDMTKATVQSGNGSLVPTMSNATNGAHETAPVGIMMHDYPSTWHALLMCLVVAIIIPFDSMLLRLFHKTLIHYILEAISMIFLIIGLGLGFYISTWFVRVSILYTSFCLFVSNFETAEPAILKPSSGARLSNAHCTPRSDTDWLALANSETERRTAGAVGQTIAPNPDRIVLGPGRGRRKSRFHPCTPARLQQGVGSSHRGGGSVVPFCLWRKSLLHRTPERQC